MNADNEDIDGDDEPEGPTVVYRCNKCGEKITFTMMSGTPLEELPCKCGGILVYTQPTIVYTQPTNKGGP